MTSSKTASPVAFLTSQERLPPFLSRSELTEDSKIVLPHFKWQRLWIILLPMVNNAAFAVSSAAVGSTSRQSTQASMGFIAIVYSRQYHFLASTSPSNISSKNM
ncbi:hypothetical protein C4D60_Mb09t05820 [Musa balbisiana]|uniref:Uncharacterized protein n=1 Tax=Musa balbisiana TaxID=52838 RepID=A0A4S8IEF8_MUSBA|nr:hypothetical protein C4D60_Mb09t05820 [Musa balbisiana]